jgi:hypothetical protein
MQLVPLVQMAHTPGLVPGIAAARRGCWYRTSSRRPLVPPVLMAPWGWGWCRHCVPRLPRACCSDAAAAGQGWWYCCCMHAAPVLGATWAPLLVLGPLLAPGRHTSEVKNTSPGPGFVTCGLGRHSRLPDGASSAMF